MDDEEKYLFLPTIPQRTVPVWIPTCDDDDNDDDDYDDDDSEPGCRHDTCGEGRRAREQ